MIGSKKYFMTFNALPISDVTDSSSDGEVSENATVVGGGIVVVVGILVFIRRVVGATKYLNK